MLSAALVGCGRRAAAYLEAYRRLEGVKPTACYAPNPKRRERVAARYGLRPYDSLEALLRAESPDVVHVVTWPDVRVGLMERVSAFGIPAATVEKPLATNPADVRRLRDLDESSGTKFAVCHQLRWHPTLVKCREAIASGALGRPLLAEMSAGLDLYSQGTHALSYGRYLLGDPRVRRVTGQVHGHHPEEGGQSCPAATLGYLELEGPARAIWSTGDISPVVVERGAPWQHLRIRVFAERGRVTYAECGESAIVASGEKRVFAPVDLYSYKEQALEAQAGFQQAVLRWLGDGSCPPGTCLSESLHEAEVLLAMLESARSGAPVEVRAERGAAVAAGAGSR
jgi:predicted dehydrogenase